MANRLSLRLQITRLFPALKHKNFRFYFSGQLLSLSGTWLQTVAQGWLVFQLTHSAFLVGLVAALLNLPVLFFGIFGGVIVDRLNKQRILIYTQAISLFLALILGILTIWGFVNIWIVATMAFLLGIVNAIDTPARQALTIEMVGREHLPSAISLNIGSFNAARVIGPAIAGVLIAKFGVGFTFILNGFTFLGPLIALKRMRLNLIPVKSHHHPLLALKIGLRYAYHHPIIRTLLIFTAVTSIFGWSFTTLLPVIAETIFHQSAFGLGLLFSGFGIGAIFGTVFISIFHNRFSSKRLLLSASFLLTSSIFAFSLTSNFYSALALMLLIGFGSASQMSIVNSTIQGNVENHLRGRVMSIFTTCNMGMLPIGSFLMGYLAEHFGSQIAISFGATIVFLLAVYLYFTFTKLENIEYSAIT